MFQFDVDQGECDHVEMASLRRADFSEIGLRLSFTDFGEIGLLLSFTDFGEIGLRLCPVDFGEIGVQLMVPRFSWKSSPFSKSRRPGRL